MQSESFERDGYALLPGFLKPRELRRARVEVEALLSRPLPSGCERPHNTLAPLSFDDAVVDLALASEARVERLRAAVGARDLRWISGYISIKEPNSAALWWHQDWWCWDHPISYGRRAPQVAVLCYLTATSAGAGALRLLPRSHRVSVRLHEVLAEGLDESTLNDQHPAMADQPDQATPEVNAGDAIAIDYRLLHGCHPHRGRKRRDCLVLNFAPGWSELPGEIRAHLISHPAQPRERSPVTAWQSALLPSFDGPRRDLPLSRHAPAQFVAGAGALPGDVA